MRGLSDTAGGFHRVPDLTEPSRPVPKLRELLLLGVHLFKVKTLDVPTYFCSRQS